MQNSSKNGHAIALINNGFLEYADSSNIDSLKTELENSFDIYETNIFRVAHIDAEELAEFSFDFFLPSLNMILSKRQFYISVSKLNQDDESFDILINEHTINLYTEIGLRNETFWEVASRNFFRKVNELLAVKEISEQFCLFYGGNDLHAMLLTDKQYDIIFDYYAGEINKSPYKP